MSWTKRQFIEEAFDEAGLAAYVFDLSPSQMNSAKYKMDRMLAVWNAKGIRIGYPIPPSRSTDDLNVVTNVPDSAHEAIITNLAIRIAPSYGKIISKDTKNIAKSSLTVLLLRATRAMEVQFPETMPLGAGHKVSRTNFDPYIRKPTEFLEPGSDDIFEFY